MVILNIGLATNKDDGMIYCRTLSGQVSTDEEVELKCAIWIHEGD